MDPINLNTREAILLLTLVGIVIGFLLGLVPLIYGRIRGKTRLGVMGLVISIVAGAIWSILPLFVMLTFVFLIIRDPAPPSDDPVAKSDSSVEDSSDQ